ncbi:hypothetical protein S40285_00681 [Stachybotrys chlorohalonatus IBT 40285]|uniref:Basic proline-rich protein n=1 Tax=Stachybotrys chlorohalonatus (strain IBT 40285) TaxID=1283841 RepID=A0A084QRB9_STAC4|nr:hypothetical protein S40285_00681 [Stachybotrys chlorohalonata IBT 40285]
MEPVPETERMEEFRPSPVPSLRRTNPSLPSPLDFDSLKKPPTLRRSTDPSPRSPISPSWSTTTGIPYRPRTASPLSGSHSRSRSVASLAPPMSRTQSMPGVSGSGQILYLPASVIRPSSPSGSPNRMRAPRKPVDEAFPPSSPVRSSVLEGERRHPERSSSPSLGTPSLASARLRRPASPLRNFNPPPTSAGTTSSFSANPAPPCSASPSPSYRSYEMLSTSYGGSLSSVPSTPTSTRSRSPSISSLETIPDSPDAEEAALEAERISQLKAAADAADGGESADSKGRSSLDVPTRGRTLAFGSRDKRKRWSVCGAERRGDIDLETIWED